MAAKGDRWARLRRLGIGGIFGIALGLALVQFTGLGREGRSLAEVVAGLAVLLVAFYLGVALHELGHLVGGLLVGFRFRFCTFGPVAITRRGDRLHIGLTARLLNGGLAGSVPEDDRDLRRRMLAMLAGGPLASLVAAVACGGLALGLEDRLGEWPGFLLRAVAGLSLLLFAVSIVPRTVGGFKTDGAAILLLARGGPATERYVAIFGLVAAMMGRGVRYGDLDPDAIARALEPADGSSHHLTAHLLAYGHARDRGEIDAAGRHLDAAMALRDVYPAPFRPDLDLTAAYFEARHRFDPAKARTHLELGRKDTPLKEPYKRALAEAAVLLAEGDLAGARARAEAGLLQADGGVNPGAARSAADALRDILQRAGEVAAPVG